MSKFLSSILILLVLTVAFANAQTRGENFEKKYGKPIAEGVDIQEFYIRKDIILKVFYDDKNIPQEFLIFQTNELNVINGDLADEIKEELIPAKERIGKPNNFSLNGGGGLYGEIYRNVEILTQVSSDGIVKINIKVGKFSEGVRIIPEEDL